MSGVSPQGIIPPIPGLRLVYSLLSKLCTPENLEPEVHVLGMRLTWVHSRLLGNRAISVRKDESTASVLAHLQDDGSVVWAKAYLPDVVIDLRNLAIGPERRLRRYGFDEQRCPFCGISLDYGTLDFGLGHCQPCGNRLGWPCDQFTADCAEDDLREDIMREIEDEDRCQ